MKQFGGDPAVWTARIASEPFEGESDALAVIIARTDALAVNGCDDTVERAELYHRNGADMVFVDGIRTDEELRTYSERLARKGISCLYNGSLVSVSEAGELGFRLQILAGLALGAVYTSANEAMEALKATGSAADVIAKYQVPGDAGLNESLGLSEFYERERRYSVTTA